MNDTPRPPSRARSIFAVLAGVFVIVVLSVGTDMAMYATGAFPPEGESMADAMWLLPTAYRVIYGVAGCYLAARLAPAWPMRHAMILGAIGFVMGIAGLAATCNKGPEFGPKWYPLAILAIQLPCGWAGGRVREMQLHGRGGRSFTAG
jgi:hypothetical protein